MAPLIIAAFPAVAEAKEATAAAASAAAGGALPTPDLILKGLPAPIATAKTDADGRFSVKLKDGEYVVVAESERNVGTSVERYHWIVRLRVPSVSEVVLLSNDNLHGTNCDSCIRVKDLIGR